MRRSSSNTLRPPRPAPQHPRILAYPYRRTGDGNVAHECPKAAASWRSIVSLKHRARQEAIALFPDHGITLATQLFQPWPVQHRDLPADIADNTELVQFAGGFGDPFTAHAEHVGDELLGHGQLVGWQAIEREQQPAAQLLVHRVMPIAHCGLRHLRDQGLGVAQQQKLHFPISMELVLELLSDHPVSVAGALHDRPTRGGFTAHNSAMPMRPSLPTTEISAEAPSASTYNSDTMESVGKYTWRRTSPDSYKTFPSGIGTSRRWG